MSDAPAPRGFNVQLDDGSLIYVADAKSPEQAAQAGKLYQQRQAKVKERSTPLGTVDAFIRGTADTATSGFADEAAAGMRTAIGQGQGSYGDLAKRYDENLKREREIDSIDEQANPTARLAGQVTGGVLQSGLLTRAGLSPVAKAIQGGASRGAQIAAGAAEGAAQGGFYGFGSGEGGLMERAAGVFPPLAAGAVGGALGEAAAPYVQRAGQWLGNKLGLTSAPEKVTADQIVEGMGASLRKDAEAGTRGIVDPKTGVRLTQGQASGDFGQIAKEEAMRADAMGPSAGKIIRDFDKGQADDIAAAAARITQGPAEPGRVYARTGEAMNDLGDIANKRWAKVGEAYDAARDAAGQTAADPFKYLGRKTYWDMANNDGSIIDSTLHPASARAVRYLDDLIPEGKDDIVGIATQKVAVARQALGKLAQGAKDPQDKLYMRQIMERFDDAWEQSADNLAFSGSEEALNKLKVARQLRRNYSKDFEPQNPLDDAGRTIDKIFRDDRSATEVANWLYGQSKVGEKGLSVRLIERIAQAGGEPVMQKVRLGALDRLLYEPEGKLFGPQRMVSRIEDYLQGAGSEYARKLHTPEQIAALQNFMDVLKRTIPPAKATNSSGSAYAASRLTQDATKRLMQVFGVVSGGPLGLAAVAGAGAAGNAIGTRSARQAVQGNFPIPKLPASPLFGSAAAGGGAALLAAPTAQ